MAKISISDVFTAFASALGIEQGDDAGVARICSIGSNRFVIGFQPANNVGVYGVVAVVSGSEIYFGDVTAISSVSGASPFAVLDVCLLDDRVAKPKVLFTYTTLGGAKPLSARWVEVDTSDNSLTAQTEVAVFTDGQAMYPTCCCQIDHGSAMIFFQYQLGVDHQHLNYAHVIVNGASLDVTEDKADTGTDLIHTAVAPSNIHMSATKVDRGLCVCGFFDEDENFSLITIITNALGEYMQAETNVAGSDYSPWVCKYDRSTMLAVYPKTLEGDALYGNVLEENFTRGADELGGNGDMDDAAAVATWTGSDATLSSVSGGQSGNCMKVLENGGANPYAYCDLTLAAGTHYEIDFYVKAGDEASWEVHAYDVFTSAYLGSTEEEDATSSWVRQRLFFKAIDGINKTRIILQQRCEAAAGTYVLFDEVVVKSVSVLAWTSNETELKEDDITSRCIHLLDSSNALVLYYDNDNAKEYILPVAISGTTLVAGTAVENTVTSNDIDCGYALLHSVTGSLYNSFMLVYDPTDKNIYTAMIQYHALPAATGYCKARDGDGNDIKLRLVATADADYNSLRVYQDSTVMAADLVADNPPFTDGFPVRVYHATDGVLCWRDDSA